MDLKSRLEMAGQNLLGCLSASHGYLPNWNMRINDDLTAELRMTSPNHNVGRWWDAMLRLEEATGFAIPPHMEGGMLANTHAFFDNPDKLCWTPLEPKYGEPVFEVHSLREGLLALNALARYRGSEWAAEKGHRMLETVDRLSDDDGNWDWDGFDYRRRVKDALKDDPEQLEKRAVETSRVESHGRLIEALVWFYESTNDSLALDLAGRFARYHLKNSASADGTFNDASGSSHTHSYLGMLRGLLLYGVATGQHEYVDAVAATYEVTIPRMVKESGWACHDLFADDPKRGETTSPGDAAQIALWLALNAGRPEHLDDVERIVRARMIPSQVTEPPPLLPTVDDGADEHRDIQNRAVGAIGGMHKGPHSGKANTTDVTAACLHTLIDVYNNIVVPTDAGLAVYFHFDYEDASIAVRSERNENARVSVTSRTGEDLLVRIPRWTPDESVRFTDDGEPVTPSRIGDFAYFPGKSSTREVVLVYDLPERRTTETIGDHVVFVTESFRARHSGTRTEHELTWRGDEIVGICPNDDWLPFYPTAEGCS